MRKMKEKFMRWDTLLFQYFKRDWKKILIWVLGIGIFSAGYVPAFIEITKDNKALIGMYQTLQNPAMTSIIGPTPIDTATDYTLGAMYSHTMLLFCGLFSMIMSALHIVGHTRKEEDLGILELVRSFHIGRQANSLAALKEISIINILITIFIGGLMYSFNAETISLEGAFLFGASIGMAGILGGALALVMSQIMSSSSSATGSTLGIIGLLYIIRAATDVSNIKLSMINPLSWTYLTYPFTEDNWLPLLFAFILSIVLVVLAFALEGNRDMGAGYLPEREGRAHAKQSLLSIPGLFIRINRGVIIAWLVGYLVLSVTYGSIYGDMETFLNSSEIVQQMFNFAGFSIEESFTSTIMMVMMGLVCILPIIIVNKLYNVESRLYISQLHATKVIRGQFYWVNIGLAVLSGLLGIFAVAIGLGGTAISVMSDSSRMEILDFFAAGLNFLPAILFFIGLAALALGWLPGLGKTVYVYLTYSFVLNYFSGILDLPNWFIKTAIKSWIPRMPMENFDGTIFFTITAISIGMIVMGYIGYKNRDMVEGS